jgi:hypothetical protein
MKRALAQMECMHAGLAAAAVAAAQGSHWGLCMQLLWELAVQDAGKAQKAVHEVHAAVSKQQQQQRRRRQEGEEDAQQPQLEELPEWLQPEGAGDCAQQHARRQQERHRKQQADNQAAIEVADALLADWLRVRRQQADELKDAVLAAVKGAAVGWSRALCPK